MFQSKYLNNQARYENVRLKKPLLIILNFLSNESNKVLMSFKHNVFKKYEFKWKILKNFVSNAAVCSLNSQQIYSSVYPFG